MRVALVLIARPQRCWQLISTRGWRSTSRANAVDGRRQLMLTENFLTARDGADDRFSQQEETKRLFDQPDVLCVNEYLYVYQCRPAETPERRLLAAILRDAIDCYTRDCFAKNRYKKRSYREAEEWFFKTDDLGIFSLESVCGILNIDPGYIRRSLIRYKQNHAPEAEATPMPIRRDMSAIELPLAS